MLPLTFYNSLTRATEPFAPIDPTDVRVYSCGPTVYNYAHLGNLRAYVFTDTLARVLRWRGYPLTHVINITDVGHLQSDADAGEDKMEARAKATGQDIWAIAAHYTAAFKQNLRDLNVVEPTHFPLATDHVAAMIAFGEAIEAKHCYRLDSGLYFDVSTVPEYGRLARSRDDEGEGRIDPVAGKRHPQDFAIWRASPPGENRQMEWDSPWGRGAPGWHLECSVMSRQYLGAPFDIHTGGIDHREIHHPNEIAQNQAFGGCADTGAKLWMHNNFLVDRTGKMAKSSGQFLTLQAVIDRGYHPLAYRLMCLQAHYRSEMEFSWEGLAAALTRLKRLASGVEKVARATTGKKRNDPNPIVQNARDAFDRAVSNDLNTAVVVTEFEKLIKYFGQGTLPADDCYDALLDMDEVLGLGIASLNMRSLRVRPPGVILSDEDVERKLDARREARAGKDYARSDAIRDELAAAGVEVMDGDPLGWDWRPLEAEA
ncbi:cysteine--tRNA ligase [Sphingomonas sp.]|jgi:cysteinyl-tRNA synthetase|uniref:cysteine--tRNA ligase n=1 Tax=Sphingomonas sp. TaxID=28214 RepID=UPI002D802A51|nr:cysteine--tRNA ligase [Sphingomonas sp.]HEU0044511.1 cysteine--tRNA ligase [Sphingomonas sp.]